MWVQWKALNLSSNVHQTGKEALLYGLGSLQEETSITAGYVDVSEFVSLSGGLNQEALPSLPSVPCSSLG